jgi:hypothetical protein
MPVLGGALANSQFGGDGSAPYKDYLDAMLALGPVFDGLSIHDYPSAGTAGDWFDQTLNIARDELDSHGRRDTPLWVTEFGISTAGPNPVTAQDQAARLVQMLSELGKRRDVRAGLIHTLIPAPTGPETEEYGYSTLNPDGSVKPAYCALAAARGVRHGRRCPAPPS